MQVARSAETFVPVCQITRHHTAEDC